MVIKQRKEQKQAVIAKIFAGFTHVTCTIATVVIRHDGVPRVINKRDYYLLHVFK